jgi:hypothetical protein
MSSITGTPGYRRPGADWDWSDGCVETIDSLRHDLFLTLVNDDESDTLGCDAAIRDAQGVVHMVATATDGPTELS